MKRVIGILVVVVVISLISVKQYQKYVGNKISMGKELIEIENMVKKEGDGIYEIIIFDGKRDYVIRDKEMLDEIMALFQNLNGTILDTNKKGIEGTNYDYQLVFNFGEYESDVDYWVFVRMDLYLSKDKIDVLSLRVIGDGSLMEFNGELEENPNSFTELFIGKILEIIESGKFS